MVRLVLTPLAVLLCQAAHAEPVLDQVNYAIFPHNGYSRLAVFESQSFAQTFVAGRDGLLSRVELYIEKSPGLTGAMELSLHRVASVGFEPLVLETTFETSINVASLPDIMTPQGPVVPTFIDVSAFGMQMRSGEKYAISLSGDGPGAAPWVLWLTGPDYLGGEFYRSRPGNPWVHVDSPVDMTFAIYVEPIPEPATWALVAVAGVIALLKRAWLRPT